MQRYMRSLFTLRHITRRYNVGMFMEWLRLNITITKGNENLKTHSFWPLSVRGLLIIFMTDNRLSSWYLYFLPFFCVSNDRGLAIIVNAAQDRPSAQCIALVMTPVSVLSSAHCEGPHFLLHGLFYGSKIFSENCVTKNFFFYPDARRQFVGYTSWS